MAEIRYLIVMLEWMSWWFPQEIWFGRTEELRSGVAVKEVLSDCEGAEKLGAILAERDNVTCGDSLTKQHSFGTYTEGERTFVIRVMFWRTGTCRNLEPVKGKVVGDLPNKCISPFIALHHTINLVDSEQVSGHWSTRKKRDKERGEHHERGVFSR